MTEAVESIGSALRDRILNKITPILLSSDMIADSNTRMLIQAYCLDVVTGLEDVIKQLDLDLKRIKPDGDWQ